MRRPSVAPKFFGTIARLRGSNIPPNRSSNDGSHQPVRLTSTELTPDILEDATIYDADDNKVGSVSHVHGSGAASQVVIDVGGFLGIGAKPVAVPASQLEFMRDEDGDVHAVTNWTKDQLKNMPEHHDA